MLWHMKREVDLANLSHEAVQLDWHLPQAWSQNTSTAFMNSLEPADRKPELCTAFSGAGGVQHGAVAHEAGGGPGQPVARGCSAGLALATGLVPKHKHCIHE